MTDTGDPLSSGDRVRAGLEAFIIGLTPGTGTGPIVDQYVSEHPEVGILRSVNEMFEADSEAKKQGEEAVSEPVERELSADESDPPGSFLDGLRDLSVEWSSPYVDHFDRDDAEPFDPEFDGSSESE